MFRQGGGPLPPGPAPPPPPAQASPCPPPPPRSSKSLPPPPPLFLGSCDGDPDGLTVTPNRLTGEVGGGTTTYDALIILRYVSWGEFFFQNKIFRVALWRSW